MSYKELLEEIGVEIDAKIAYLESLANTEKDLLKKERIKDFVEEKKDSIRNICDRLNDIVDSLG